MIATAAGMDVEWVVICAWCQRIRDSDGEFSIPPNRSIRPSSHGICEPCSVTLLAEAGAWAGA